MFALLSLFVYYTMEYNYLLDLPDEIINFISEFLTIAERTTTKYVCKQMHDAISIKLCDFENILVKKINMSTKSNIGSDLLKIIKESDDYVSIGGSTINQCLHYDFLPTSDIDIYINYDPYSEDNKNYDQFDGLVSDKILEQKYVKLCTDLISNKTNLSPECSISNCVLPVENYMIDGYHINYYEPNGEDDENYSTDTNFVVIQFILLPTNYDKEDIFDFTFSANKYDGANVHSKSKKDVLYKNGFMNEWSNIYEKAIYVKGCTMARVCEHMLLRANKYIQRGYKIANLSERLNEIDNTIKKDILRQYHDPKCKICEIGNTPFNDWLYNRFASCSGVSMGTRTIETIFEDENGNKNIMNNNKGNPIISQKYD